MPRTLPVAHAAFVLGAALCLGLAPSSSSQGLEIDFESFAPGAIVADRIATHSQPDGDWTLIVTNLSRSFDLAVTYDSAPMMSGEDPDLEIGDGWAGGNLAPDTQLGNLLIIQENDDCSATACLSPDDEGRQPAGSFLFLFDGSFQMASFDLVDIEEGEADGGSITFYRGDPGDVDNRVASFAFSDFLALGQGVEYGDNTANHIDLGLIGDFDAVEIALRGSGGLDNLRLVPEPDLAALVVLGLAGLLFASRRRRTALQGAGGIR